MLTDALLCFFNADGATLEGATAGGTVYSNVVDLSTSRDIATSGVPVSVQFSTLPTSGTGGTTLNIAIQTSPDNATWTTLEETSALPIANITTVDPYAFRGTLNVGVLRYLRIAMTPSAVITAGVVTAQMGGDWPRMKSYPRNYVA